MIKINVNCDGRGKDVEALSAERDAACEQVEALESRVTELEGTLRLYAPEWHYTPGLRGRPAIENTIMEDKGTVARKVLYGQA